MLKSGLRFERRCIMQVKVERLGKVSFLVKTRGHTVVSDQPESNGGLDAGVTPPELFLASLGTCVGYYVAEFFDARKWECDKIEIEVRGEILPNPARIGKISLDLNVPLSLDEKHFQALLRTVSHCTIHNTLTHPPEIQVRIQTPSPALVGC